VKVEVVCDYCQQRFTRSISKYNQDVKKGWKQFCSQKCHWLAQNKRKQVVCACCGVTFIKELVQIKRSKIIFVLNPVLLAIQIDIKLRATADQNLKFG
jgi:hypothetical protein